MGNITAGMIAKLRAETSLQRLVEGCGVEMAKVRGKSGRLVGDCLFCGEAKALTVDPAANYVVVFGVWVGWVGGGVGPARGGRVVLARVRVVAPGRGDHRVRRPQGPQAAEGDDAVVVADAVRAGPTERGPCSVRWSTSITGR